jgi:hypothetical protein
MEPILRQKAMLPITLLSRGTFFAKARKILLLNAGFKYHTVVLIPHGVISKPTREPSLFFEAKRKENLR